MRAISHDIGAHFAPGVSRVQSTLALRTVKKTTELPV
jgi:hypothetical protein